MGVVLGIDIGGSTTKIVGKRSDGGIIAMTQVKANDAITSVYGAFGKFVNENRLSLSDIDRIMVTGVGSSQFKDNIYNIPTFWIDEFLAIGIGGLYLSHKKEAIVVSMGTGTAFVRATEEKITHIGGSGVGGGTILGLCNRMVGAHSIETIMQKASLGDLSNVDLMIKDISTGIKSLPPNATASNFGKLSDIATDEDITLGILNMTYQTIAMLAVFACKNDTIKDIVLTGTLTILPQSKQVFDNLRPLYDVNFIIPENAIYSTAIGAMLYVTE